MEDIKVLKIIEWLLRIGVAFSFIYPAVSAFFNPYAWVGYFPTFLLELLPVESIFILHAFGIIEILIAVWILFGKNVFIPSLMASVILFLIIVLNLNQMDVIFRDIPILLMALLLCVLHNKRHNV